jgi:hypothetical protein
MFRPCPSRGQKRDPPALRPQTRLASPARLVLPLLLWTIRPFRPPLASRIIEAQLLMIEVLVVPPLERPASRSFRVDTVFQQVREGGPAIIYLLLLALFGLGGLLLSGTLTLGRETQREKERADRLESLNRDLVEVNDKQREMFDRTVLLIQQQIVPMLERAARAQSDARGVGP